MYTHKTVRVATPITAVVGGKMIGLGSRVTLDPALGCVGACVGCYAAKTTRLGPDVYHSLTKVKSMVESELIRSIKHVQSKGHNYARVGKSCDPGLHLDELTFILKTAQKLDFRCVVVSKYLMFNDKIADLLREGDHTLHISLGMESEKIPSEEKRISAGKQYFAKGVRTSFRICDDVTRPYRDYLDEEADKIPKIITPMRYPSKADIASSQADLSNFVFEAGYYKPKEAHSSWKEMLPGHGCGKIGDKYHCSNCGVLWSKPEVQQIAA